MLLAGYAPTLDGCWFKTEIAYSFGLFVLRHTIPSLTTILLLRLRPLAYRNKEIA
jgi:hypothetical protein